MNLGSRGGRGVRELPRRSVQFLRRELVLGGKLVVFRKLAV